MIGAGTFISPLIKVATTVAILAAIYFFFVKPALDTTENISNQAFNQALGSDAQNLEDDLAGTTPQEREKRIKKALREAEKRSDSSFQQSIEVTGSGASLESASKLLDCIGKAAGDIDKITACSEKHSP